jgi:hypothetical protein
MRYLKIYEDFKYINSICKKYGIENYTIVDGKVNVNGDVDLTDRGLVKLPVSFGAVTGSFYCVSNKLTSLEGAPNSVGGGFYCYYNKLTKLEGSPSNVGGNFNCSDNKLTSLEGVPSSVGGHFFCVSNQLTSLEGCPNSVGGHFNCSDNHLTSLEGAPNSVGEHFSCSYNPVYELYSLFKDYSKVELFNYMDIVYEPEGDDKRPVIYLVKLNEFLKEIGKKPVTSLKNYNCL